MTHADKGFVRSGLDRVRRQPPICYLRAPERARPNQMLTDVLLDVVAPGEEEDMFQRIREDRVAQKYKLAFPVPLWTTKRWMFKPRFFLRASREMGWVGP